MRHIQSKLSTKLRKPDHERLSCWSIVAIAMTMSSYVKLRSRIRRLPEPWPVGSCYTSWWRHASTDGSFGPRTWSVQRLRQISSRHKTTWTFAAMSIG